LQQDVNSTASGNDTEVPTDPAERMKWYFDGSKEVVELQKVLAAEKAVNVDERIKECWQKLRKHVKIYLTCCQVNLLMQLIRSGCIGIDIVA
jgi:hypothetical protein